MTMSTRFRALSTGLGAALVAVLLPLAGPAAPAHATECTSEVQILLPPSACDDVTPPETTLSAMTPGPNGAGWTGAGEVAFTFEATTTDADPDAMLLECKLEGPSQAHDWVDCDSPRTYTALEDGTDSPAYTFSVRAYDSADRAIDYDDPTTPLTNEDEVADEDASPGTRTWRQDTEVPATLLLEGPHDSEGTGWPIARQPRATFLLDSTEDDVDYRCRLDGKAVGCGEGRLTLRSLSGGNKVLSVTVTDRAGNEDPTPATKQFTVPFDLTKGKKWKRVRAKGYFDRSYLQSRRRGARLTFKAHDVREFRLIAPAGPTLGKLRVRVGHGIWKTVNLRAAKADRSAYYVIRDQTSPRFTGPIRIEALSAGKPVRVDALVFPPG